MIKENKGTLICVSYCDEDAQFSNETYHIQSGEKISRDFIIERLAGFMQDYEDHNGIAVSWATAAVIPLTDPKQTWRIEWRGEEISAERILQ